MDSLIKICLLAVSQQGFFSKWLDEVLRGAMLYTFRIVTTSNVRVDGFAQVRQLLLHKPINRLTTSTHGCCWFER